MLPGQGLAPVGAGDVAVPVGGQLPVHDGLFGHLHDADPGVMIVDKSPPYCAQLETLERIVKQSWGDVAARRCLTLSVCDAR